MDWKDILFLFILFVVAGFVLYRSYRKKKWCPAVFGSNDQDAPDKNKDE